MIVVRAAALKHRRCINKFRVLSIVVAIKGSERGISVYGISMQAYDYSREEGEAGHDDEGDRVTSSFSVVEMMWTVHTVAVNTTTILHSK